jgi:hypothetical protein
LYKAFRDNRITGEKSVCDKMTKRKLSTFAAEKNKSSAY